MKRLRKKKNITFRVTEDEFKMIKEKAMKQNLTMTDFIVICCREKNHVDKFLCVAISGICLVGDGYNMISVLRIKRFLS